VGSVTSRESTDAAREPVRPIRRAGPGAAIIPDVLVLVTGGTGYVGSHSIAALTAAGHRVRVLARSPDRVAPALEPLGVDGVETALGDVTDPAAVERALQGCDAVLHAASVFSMVPGGMHITDVRDVAKVHAAVMEPGRGPRSFIVAGHYLSMGDIIRTVADLTGHRIRFVTAPAFVLSAFGRVADAIQDRVKTRLPWDHEGIWVLNCAARCDDSKTRAELGVQPRPIRETFADTVRWLVQGGHVTAAEVGRLA